MRKIIVNFFALVILLTGLGFISIFSSDNTALAQDCPKVSRVSENSSSYNYYVPLGNGLCDRYTAHITERDCMGVGSIPCCGTGVITEEVNYEDTIICP